MVPNAPHSVGRPYAHRFFMTKTFEVISEAVRNTKHVFTKAENHTKKSLRNRYERRKVRSYLTLADWMLGENS
jgi:hypothetical protein